MGRPGLMLAVAFVMTLVGGDAHAADDVGPSFLNEVVPILTRAGCNQGSCHGKGAGQNGFRLSLRGYAPKQDHRSLTREFDGRRIDPTRPENSLLLLKATAQVPHEGGRLRYRAQIRFRCAVGSSPASRMIWSLGLKCTALRRAVRGLLPSAEATPCTCGAR